MSSLFQSMHQSNFDHHPRMVAPERPDESVHQTQILSPPLSPYPKMATTTTSTSSAVRNETFSLKDSAFSNPQAKSPASSPAIANSVLAQLPGLDSREVEQEVVTSADSANDEVPTSPTDAALTSTLLNTLQVASQSDINSRYTIQKHDPKKPMVSNAWTCYQKDPVGYFKRELAYLGLYSHNGPTWSNYVRLGPSKDTERSIPSSRPSRIKRRRINLPDEPESNVATRSVTRGSNGITKPSSRASTPKPRVRTGSPAVSSSRVHDAELDQIKDYCPPVETLPPGKSLKADWKGAPMDLSDDPLFHLLHPAEVHLASVLRLPCQLYLDSKKRLFAEKVHRLRNGLPFRRTDSQKACRIDVNKASRLYSAFERVGWLDDDLFEHFLN